MGPGDADGRYAGVRTRLAAAGITLGVQEQSEVWAIFTGGFALAPPPTA